MNLNTSDLTITSIETITAFDINTGDFKFSLDELQTATIAQGQDVVEITGKQGRRLNTLKRNKTVTISGTNGLLSTGLIEMQAGTPFEEGESTVRITEYLTVESNQATTKYKAVGTAGNELKKVFVHNDNGTLGEAITQDAAAAEGKFAYDPETKEITFNEGEVADGTEIVVFYDRKINASTQTNMSDVYSDKCTLYVDVLCEDICNNVYHAQFYIPKADFDGNFELAMGEDQTVHSFEASALAGTCGTAGIYWKLTVFGEDAEDIA